MTQFKGKILLPVPEDEALFNGYPISGFYVATQIVNRHRRPVMIRKYKHDPTNQTADAYFDFLKDLKHYNMFESNYKLNDSGETVFAFTNTVTCTLQSYLSCYSEKYFVTPAEGRFQQDFTDTLVSILRQILDVIDYLHANNVRTGDMSLESIFLDCEPSTPRVLILPPPHEAAAKLGGYLPLPETIDLRKAQDDWSRFGSLLASICAALNLSDVDSALEIFDLSTKLFSKKFNSTATIRRHPALLFGYRKSAFVVEFYEAVLRQRQYIGRFSYKPQELRNESWKIRFQYLIHSLSEQKKIEIGRQLDDLYNFIKFVRNTIEHSLGTPDTMNNLGDPPSILRYFRDYYKHMLIDLISKAAQYVEADAAIRRLLQD